MGPLEEQLRWERVWNVTILDSTALLSDELSFPMDAHWMQGFLRPALEKHYLEHDYQLGAGQLHFVMISTLRSAANEEQERQFYLWGVRTLALGSDRLDEFFWRSVVYDREEVTKPEWMEDAFQRVRNDIAGSRKLMMEKIEAVGNRLSDFDEEILARVEITDEYLATLFCLTADYNLFARCWRAVTEDFSMEQLGEIYDVGKKLAAVRQVSETAVGFPGTWDFGPPGVG